MKPMYIIFIGAIIIAVGGFIAAYGTLGHNKKSSEKSDNILDKANKSLEEAKIINENIETNLAMARKFADEQSKFHEKQIEFEKKQEWFNTEQNALLEKQKVLLERQDNILNLSQESINNLTGGDSYPVVTPGIHINEKYLTFELENKFRYPIYDLKLSYSDPNKVRKFNNEHPNWTTITDEEFNTYHIKESIGNISPHTFRPILEYHMPKEITKDRFIFTMICRTGTYIQVFDVTRDKDSTFIIHGHLEKLTDGIQKILFSY